MANQQIPDGYLEDSEGRLVSIDKVPEIDKLRDALVHDIVGDLMPILHEYHQTQTLALQSIAAFIQLSAEEHGVQIGGEKGNTTLNSFNGEYRVLRAVQDRFTVNEKIHAAKALIDEVTAEWAEKSEGDLKAAIEAVFKPNAKGKLSVSELRKLLGWKIKDPRWLNAMDIIKDSISVVDTKAYIRIYKRDEQGEYRYVSGLEAQS